MLVFEALSVLFAARIVSRPKGGRRFAPREPERREGSGVRSSPHPGEPDAGAPQAQTRSGVLATNWLGGRDSNPDSLVQSQLSYH